VANRLVIPPAKSLQKVQGANSIRPLDAVCIELVVEWISAADRRWGCCGGVRWYRN